MKTILIDIDNTLLDFNLCSQESIEKAAAYYGITLPRNYYPRFKQINDSLWKRIEEKTLDIEGLRAIRYNMIFKEWGIDFDGPTFEKMYFKGLTESAVPVEGAKDLVKYLGAKYDLYAASNAPKEQQDIRLGKAGMMDYIKGIFISEEIGAPKPTKAFFDGVFRLIGNPDPKDVVMIGDSLNADIIGAREYGMETIWFNYEGKDCDSPADHTVLTLDEIKTIL